MALLFVVARGRVVRFNTPRSFETATSRMWRRTIAMLRCQLMTARQKPPAGSPNYYSERPQSAQ